VTRYAAIAALFVAGTASAETAKDVARVRGLEIKKPIEQEIVDRADLQAKLPSQNVAYERWGLDPPVADDEDIAGTYDRVTKKLLLAAPVDEFVLIHEIEHALQDMHFDLSKVEAGTGDEAIARRALVEGDALVTTFEVLLDRKGIDPPWGNPQIVAELVRAIDVPVNDAYKAGFAFVAALRAQKPWSAIDAAFKRPPVSTEQVLHPEKYLAGEKPVTVEAPALDGATIVDATTWGELGFQLFLRAHGVDLRVAKLAAAGWAGDRVTTVEKAGHVIGLARFTWDTEADAIEAFEAAERAIDDSQLAARAENTETRTQWLALDGTVSSIERAGSEISIMVGATARQALSLK
jgi:hypothetical protein